MQVTAEFITKEIEGLQGQLKQSQQKHGTGEGFDEQINGALAVLSALLNYMKTPDPEAEKDAAIPVEEFAKMVGGEGAVAEIIPASEVPVELNPANTSSDDRASDNKIANAQGKYVNG
jgi:hypothetical protein